jgi:SpoIID/LytB domain protein
MGSKIIKSLLIFFLLIISVPVVFGYPSNSMVNVCIMDKNYSTIEKDNIVIYGTEDSIIKTVDSEISLLKGKYVQVTKNENGYKIKIFSDDDKKVEFYQTSDDFSVVSIGGVLGIKDLVRGGKPALYRGEFKIVSIPNKPTKFLLINHLDVEYYLKGVVPSEMPVSFGLEALKAQSVAARNYSLSPRTKMNRSYDVVDSTASQVYHGYNRESEIANKAIDETHGIVALCNDEMIIAVFSSTAGGYTECYSKTFSDPITRQFPAPPKSYLIAKPDLPKFTPLNNEDEAFKFYSTRPISYDMFSPLYRWIRTWNKAELENILRNTLVVQSKTGFVTPVLSNADDFGTLKEIRVIERGESGKIISMEIITDKNVFKVEKELTVRRIFSKDGKSLPSANVVFKYEVDSDGNWSEINAFGGGFGHGCGLSQFGAMYMAQKCHLGFDTILKHYYNGICLGTAPIELKDKFLAQCFYSPFKTAILVIPDKSDAEVLQMKINNQIVNLNLNNAGNKKRCEIDISRYIKQNQLNTIYYTPPCQNRLDTRQLSKIKGMKLYIKLN